MPYNSLLERFNVCNSWLERRSILASLFLAALNEFSKGFALSSIVVSWFFRRSKVVRLLLWTREMDVSWLEAIATVVRRVFLERSMFVRELLLISRLSKKGTTLMSIHFRLFSCTLSRTRLLMSFNDIGMEFSFSLLKLIAFKLLNSIFLYLFSLALFFLVLYFDRSSTLLKMCSFRGSSQKSMI